MSTSHFLESGMLFLQRPTYNEHILPINFISNTWVVAVWNYFASTLRKSNRNFIMLSPLSGPANPDFRGMAFIPPLFREPFSLITLALLLLLWFPPSSHCYSISPGLLVFILWLQSGPGPGWARPSYTDVNSYKSYMNSQVQLLTSQAHSINGSLHLTVYLKVNIQ